MKRIDWAGTSAFKTYLSDMGDEFRHVSFQKPHYYLRLLGLTCLVMRSDADSDFYCVQFHIGDMEEAGDGQTYVMNLYQLRDSFQYSFGTDYFDQQLWRGREINVEALMEGDSLDLLPEHLVDLLIKHCEIVAGYALLMANYANQCYRGIYPDCVLDERPDIIPFSHSL